MKWYIDYIKWYFNILFWMSTMPIICILPQSYKIRMTLWWEKLYGVDNLRNDVYDASGINKMRAEGLLL